MSDVESSKASDYKKIEREYEEKCLAARNAYWDVKFSDKDESNLLKLATDYISALESYNHILRCGVAKHQVTHWPRIKDLPEEERAPFRKWLSGQTCPLLTGVFYEEQDAYYQWDYERWKLTLQGKAVLWD